VVGGNSVYFFYWLFVWKFSGTVFREPILCKNIPRLVPGTNIKKIILNYFLINGGLLYISTLPLDQVGQSQYASEDMRLVTNIGLLTQ